MNNKIVIKSNNVYSLEDFYLSNLLSNELLLNELDMKTLPETFLSVFGVKCKDYYKPILKKKIELYDKSLAVNSFIYKGKLYWLDKQLRSCMKTVAESGLKEIEMVVGDEVLKLTPEFVKQFILQLEAYAYKCFVVTAKHQLTIKSLEAIRDILDYNYTTGYPEKITLQ